MYWTILILVNIPIYLLLGWVVFDTKDKAADTFFDTTVAILSIIFIPRFVRVLMDMDDTDSYGILEIGLFFVGCVAITYGEHVLLSWYFFSD